jgi:predicted flap endonuclease-1-like 5' DNA nuclease
MSSELTNKNLDDKIDGLKNSFGNLYSKLDVDNLVSSKDADISGVESRLNSKIENINYQEKINNLEFQLSSYHAKLDELKNDFQMNLQLKDQTIAELEERIKLIENPPEPVRVPKDDDLKRISGVGPVLEKLLHDNGIISSKQVAQFNDAQIDNLSEKLSFQDRIRSDDWMTQAKKLHLEKYGEEL